MEYYTEKRASAKKMLSHPWLKMPDNFDYKMSDIEIEKMNMIENTKKNNINNIDDYNDDYDKDRQVISSEEDNYAGDNEDNDKNVFSNDEESEESGDENPDKIHIQNFNNSFAQYGQFVDLTALDRANPQFNNIVKKK